jgi:curved DNA-binding protein CbpA
MPLKDYYSLLDIKPGADANTIKKAFRKKAKTYHPDKAGLNEQNDYFFREIREAYEVLMDPEKRNAYHYERWLDKAKINKPDQAVTAPDILKLFVQVEKNLHLSDYHQLDIHLLGPQLTALFSPFRLSIIAAENDESLLSAVNNLALSMAGNMNGNGIRHLASHFEKYLSGWNTYKKKWNLLIRQKARKEKNNKLKIPISILIALLLCLFFYLIQRS